MALTDVAIRNLKSSEKAYKKSDKDGLYLMVFPNGRKSWRYDYRHEGKRLTATLGAYPDMTLSAARSQLADIKGRLSSGEPAKPQPVAAASVPGDSFEEVSRDYLNWLSEKVPPLAERTIGKKRWILNDICAPSLEGKRMREIKASDVLEILQTLGRKGQLETAKRTRSTLSAMFRFAAWSGRADFDPVPALRGAVEAPTVTHHAAVLDEKAFGDLLASIKDYSGWYAVRMSLLFLAYTFCRPGEARLATWDEFDLKAKVWTIPAGRMKMRRKHAVPRDHKVPLSKQAMDVLNEMRRVDAHSTLVFPSVRSNRKPLSDNALNSALRRIGYMKSEHVAHGFRSSASTILNERGYESEIIEVQLSHMSGDRVKLIYDRGERWDKRVELMAAWGRICQTLSIS